MICLLSRHLNLVKELQSELNSIGITFKTAHPSSKTALDTLYLSEVTGAVVDADCPAMTTHAWYDLLASLSRRIPIVVIGDHSLPIDGTGRNLELLAWMPRPTSSEIMATMATCGILGSPRRFLKELIPVYNLQASLHMLKNNGALSVLTVNAGSFRKVAIEYGFEAYSKLQNCFHRILFEMWGASGSFRQSDILMRRSPLSNTYYIFLEQSRLTKAVPAPGLLERMADRLAVRLQSALWTEVFKDGPGRILPDCISVIPEFSIGHATALYNPCVDSVEVIDQLFESSLEISRVQIRRMRDRQRELLHTIIQGRGFLVPHYQAVFKLQGITKPLLDEMTKQKSIGVLTPHLFGFESLIRVRKELIDDKISGDDLVYLESKYLRPDVLFGLAQTSKVSLELDQVCLQYGIAGATQLPGALMVNILPRNLYHIEKLTHLLAPRGQIIFELSESEAVSNFELMETVQSYIKQLNCSLAADDIGKGYASIERIIKIQPDLIKLDRSLIENIHENNSKKAFVKGIVQAAKIAASTILAEGVEKWEEAEVLKEMGIDLIQGYLLHRPQSVELILDQLEGHTAQKLDSVA